MLCDCVTHHLLSSHSHPPRMVWVLRVSPCIIRTSIKAPERGRGGHIRPGLLWPSARCLRAHPKGPSCLAPSRPFPSLFHQQSGLSARPRLAQATGGEPEGLKEEHGTSNPPAQPQTTLRVRRGPRPIGPVLRAWWQRGQLQPQVSWAPNGNGPSSATSPKREIGELLRLKSNMGPEV